MHWLFLACVLALVSGRCVTEAQCADIHLNARYWQESACDTYNDADLILPGLYLGNVCAAHSASWLRAHGIALVISVAREWDAYTCDDHATGDAPQRVYYALNDSVTEDETVIRRALDEAVDLMITHKSTPHRAILVHCNMGISRSSALVLRYLQHRYPRRAYQRLLSLVRARRCVARPNDLLGRVLVSYEAPHADEL